MTLPLNHPCVDDDAADTAGVLVLRVWIEPSDLDRTLRIRVTTRADVTDPRRTLSRTTSSVDDTVALIRSWLDGFVASWRPGDAGGDAAVTPWNTDVCHGRPDTHQER